LIKTENRDGYKISKDAVVVAGFIFIEAEAIIYLAQPSVPGTCPANYTRAAAVSRQHPVNIHDGTDT
jgi:hypothetical protein